MNFIVFENLLLHIFRKWCNKKFKSKKSAIFVQHDSFKIYQNDTLARHFFHFHFASHWFARFRPNFKECMLGPSSSHSPNENFECVKLFSQEKPNDTRKNALSLVSGRTKLLHSSWWNCLMSKQYTWLKEMFEERLWGQAGFSLKWR